MGLMAAVGAARAESLFSKLPNAIAPTPMPQRSNNCRRVIRRSASDSNSSNRFMFNQSLIQLRNTQNTRN